MLIAKDLSYAIDPAAFAEACGVTVDEWQGKLLRERHKRCLMCCSRQSGKSTTVAIMSLHTALYDPSSLIVLAAPSQRQSAELLRTIRLLHGQLVGAPELTSDNVLRLEFSNQSRIVALPGEQKTVRGLSAAKLVVVDEAAQVDDALLAALRPMTAVSNGSIVMLSTPKGRRGAFFEAWHGDPDAWHRVSVPASACPRISPEFLESERRELGEARFSEEYALAWLDPDTSAFSTAIIDAAFDPEVRPLWH
jgi:hypothetical protein